MIVWFHGGGITGGNKSIPAELKRLNVIVIAANYRLSPKVSCPAYIEDAAAAVAWAFRNAASFGGDSNKVYVSGHSAGAYLSCMVGLDKKPARLPIILKRGPHRGHIFLQRSAITHFTVRKERGIAETQPVIDEFAPLYHVEA